MRVERVVDRQRGNEYASNFSHEVEKFKPKRGVSLEGRDFEKERRETFSGCKGQ